MTQLDAIVKGQCPWVPSATRLKVDVLDNIKEVVNESSKIGQEWLALLRSYDVTNLPPSRLSAAWGQ